jgi:hypothetical protein
MNKVCEYFDLCSMKRFYLSGKIEEKWVKNYCFNNHKNCVRYEKAKKGEISPDNMLPDGKIKKNLN